MPDPLIVIREPNPPQVVTNTIVEPVVTHGAGIPGATGPPGPRGPQGTAGGSSQAFPVLVPTDVWTITHNFGYRPVVDVEDSTGRVVLGAVQHIDANSLTVSFGAAFAGTAYLT